MRAESSRPEGRGALAAAAREGRHCRPDFSWHAAISGGTLFYDSRCARRGLSGGWGPRERGNGVQKISGAPGTMAFEYLLPPGAARAGAGPRSPARQRKCTHCLSGLFRFVEGRRPGPSRPETSSGGIREAAVESSISSLILQRTISGDYTNYVRCCVLFTAACRTAGVRSTRRTPRTIRKNATSCRQAL